MSALGWTVALGICALAALRSPRPGRSIAPTRRAFRHSTAAVAGQRVVERGGVAWARLTGGHEQLRDDQLCGALEHIASSLRAGTTLVAAVSTAAQATPEPIGGELRQVATSVRGGAPLRRALDRWCDTAGAHSGTRLAATALRLAADAGGEVGRSVDRVAATLRERREVRAEARALATQARTSAAVLIAAPFGFTALVATVEPGAIGFLVGSPLGLLCLVVGLALDAAGALWMARIVRAPA